MTAIMTPQEMERFENEGRHPDERRTCVLCCRRDMDELYMEINKLRSVPSNVLLNDYANPVDCENGYSSRVCKPSQSTASSGEWTGIFGHVVGLNLAMLRLRQNPADRHWYVDQSELRAQDF